MARAPAELPAPHPLALHEHCCRVRAMRGLVLLVFQLPQSCLTSSLSGVLGVWTQEVLFTQSGLQIQDNCTILCSASEIMIYSSLSGKIVYSEFMESLYHVILWWI